MTEKLQMLQRQALEKSVKLPTNQGFGGISQAFLGLADIAGSVAVKAGVEVSKRQGADDAAAGKTSTLAPGIGAATRAYNDAYLNTQGTLASLNAGKQLSDLAVRMTAPGTINSNTMAQFNEVAQGVLEGTLEGVDPAIKTQVGLRLTQDFIRTQGAVGGKVQSFNTKRLDDDFNYAISESIKTLRESTMGGDLDSAKESQQSVQQLLADKKALGLLSPKQHADALEAMNDTYISATVSREYLQSRVEGREEAFLTGLAETKPESMTFDQWNQATVQVLKLKGQQDRLVNQQEQLNVARWTQMLDTGQVQSVSDLEEARNDMSALSYTKLETRFIRDQLQANKSQIQIQSFLKDNALDPAKAARASSDVKDASYNMMLDGALDMKREATGNENTQLSLVDKADVARNFNTPIPEFNQELSYAFLSQGEAMGNAAEALIAYKRMAGDGQNLNRSNALSMDKRAEQVAMSALLQTERGGLDPESALARSKKNILEADDFTRQSRLTNFKNNYSGTKGAKNLQRSFKQDLDGDASNNPEIFKAYSDLLRINSMEMGTLSEAQEFTKRQMTNIVGKSKYTDDNTLMWYPPEKTVALSTEGVWFDNQVAMAVNQVANNYERAQALAGQVDENRQALEAVTNQLIELRQNPDASQQDIQALVGEANRLSREINVGSTGGVQVQWGEEGNRIPDSVSQEQLMTTPLVSFVGTERAGASGITGALARATRRVPSLVIDGTKRQVFIQSDASTMSRNNERVTYGLYYKDDFGITQPVPDRFNPRGVAEFAVVPFEEFLPSVAEEMTNKTIDEVSKKEAGAIFDLENPRSFIMDNFVPGGTMRQIEKGMKKKEFVRERSEQIKGRLKARGENE